SMEERSRTPRWISVRFRAWASTPPRRRSASASAGARCFSTRRPRESPDDIAAARTGGGGSSVLISTSWLACRDQTLPSMPRYLISERLSAGRSSPIAASVPYGPTVWPRGPSNDPGENPPMRHNKALIPSAARLMSSLRDIGYDLPNAVADLVD